MKKIFKIILLIIVIVFIYSIFKNKTETPNEPVPGDVVYNLTVDGYNRTYTVHVPKDYDASEAVPLVFVFHGGASNNTNIEKSSDFNSLSETENFLVVYPMGIQNPDKKDNQGTWNGGPAGGGYAHEKGINDIKFVREMVSEISSKYKIDAGKIYATGISMGGMMSYRIACELSDVFSAIAPVGSVLALPFEDCRPTRPVAVMHLHGTADKFVPYNGGMADPSVPKLLVVGGPYPSVQDSINRFKSLNHTQSAGQNVYSKGDTNCLLYRASTSGADVELCTITDGGHTWPGSDDKYGLILSRILGKVSQDISATSEMWTFFLNHARS